MFLFMEFYLILSVLLIFLLISYAIWPILGLLSNTWGGLRSYGRRNSVQLYSFSSGSSSLPRYLLLPFLYFDPWDETYWFPTLKSSGFRNIFCTCFKNRNPIDRYRNLSFWFCVWFIYELRNPNLSIGITYWLNTRFGCFPCFWFWICDLDFKSFSLGQKWHPDKQKGEDSATSRFQEINEAYKGWHLYNYLEIPFLFFMFNVSFTYVLQSSLYLADKRTFLGSIYEGFLANQCVSSETRICSFDTNDHMNFIS